MVVEAVGCRFERPGHNEWQHMVITPQQNTAARGYGLNATASNSDAYTTGNGPISTTCDHTASTEYVSNASTADNSGCTNASSAFARSDATSSKYGRNSRTTSAYGGANYATNGRAATDNSTSASIGKSVSP